MDLDQILSQLPRQSDENLLVGFETNDDAGVYLISEGTALVQTVDFFTPIVDDPYQFGQISAANSLSDVYAMGGKPISSLTIVGFPRSGQDFSILEQILTGGMSKMLEAKCTVVGGHSIGDEEIKFGYAVTGLIDPRKVIRNVGARVGDRLVLTKPLGTGVIGTAIKKQAAPESVIRGAVAWMTTLNRGASEAAQDFEIHAMTDVTGFGLLGHAREMAQGSGVSLEFDHTTIPAMEGARDCIRQKMIPGGLLNNRKYLEPLVEFSPDVPEEVQTLLYDPQTSGGLLIACRHEDSGEMVSKMNAQGIPAVVVGRVIGRRLRLLTIL
jgi:selenide,water dikinase